MTLIVASLAGSAGAAARYLLSGWVQETSQSEFPLGTLTVNVVGSLALGLLIGMGDVDSFPIVVGVGFLGGFTTFSTWMVETIRLGPTSSRAVLNLGLALALGVAAAALGLILTR